MKILPAKLPKTRLHLVLDQEFLEKMNYNLLLAAHQAAEGGVKVIQLRMKKASTTEFLTTAFQLRGLTREKDITLIINDRLDIALAVNADGLHIGQDDYDVQWVRRVLKKGQYLLGLSTHGPRQALQAQEDNVDYIGLGPIFATDTKETKYQPLGLEMVEKISNLVNIPVIAVGGITTEKAPEVITKGVSAVAIISSILSQPDIKTATKEFFSHLEQTLPQTESSTLGMINVSNLPGEAFLAKE